jgi:probable rRNA maturation factor
LFQGNGEEVARLIILEKKVAGLSAKSLERFTLRARRAVGLSGRVNILLTSSAAMRALNFRFREKNKTTDVLSFPSQAHFNGTDKRAFAGEIAISADIARENAAGLGHSAALEVKVLALHGILHLAGLDHERDNGKMARKEAGLRRKLGLPSSLTERREPDQHEPAKSYSSSRLRSLRRKA